MGLIPVKDKPLARDERSGAIINMDDSAYESYKLKQLAVQRQKEEQNQVRREINTIKQDLEQIKQNMEEILIFLRTK
jgi:hypothetical protein